MRSEPNDCIHALILGDLEHGDSRLLTTTTDRISPCLSKKLHRPKLSDSSDDDDTFKILNASFHGKGKGGFAQICTYRRSLNLYLILDSPSYQRYTKNSGKFVSFQNNFNHTYFRFHQPKFFNATFVLNGCF